MSTLIKSCAVTFLFLFSNLISPQVTFAATIFVDLPVFSITPTEIPNGGDMTINWTIPISITGLEFYVAGPTPSGASTSPGVINTTAQSGTITVTPQTLTGKANMLPGIYRLYMRAEGAGVTDYSSQPFILTGNASGVLSVPSQFIAQPGSCIDQTVIMSWAPVTGATSYVISSGYGNNFVEGSEMSIVGSTPLTRYTHTYSNPGIYNYSIQAGAGNNFSTPTSPLVIVDTAGCTGATSMPSTPESGSFIDQMNILYEQIAALQALLDTRNAATTSTSSTSNYEGATIVLIVKTPNFTANKTTVEVKYSGIAQVRRFTVDGTQNSVVLGRIAQVLNISTSEVAEKIQVASVQQVGYKKIEVTFKSNKKEEADLLITYKDGTEKLVRTTKADEQEIITLFYGGNEELFIEQRDDYFERARRGYVDPDVYTFIANVLRVSVAAIRGVVSVAVDDTSYSDPSTGG